MGRNESKGTTNPITLAMRQQFMKATVHLSRNAPVRNFNRTALPTQTSIKMSAAMTNFKMFSNIVVP
jgi:hypothetical protein